MKVAGKCPPTDKEFRETKDRGFENAELYLERKHLENLQNTISTAKDSGINVTSVHTPHVTLDDQDYFLKADKLAHELDAFLVFHSKYMHHVHISKCEDLEIRSKYGYENNPGASVRHIKKTILEEGHKLVLDTAHLYQAHKDCENKIEALIEDYNDQIALIHLCDSTAHEDGLGFGQGDMEMKKISEIIQDNFKGIVTLEVMPEEQEKALEIFTNI